jgi:hypothetical protein
VESNETKSNNKSKTPYKGKNKEQTLDTSDLLIENALLVIKRRRRSKGKAQGGSKLLRNTFPDDAQRNPGLYQRKAKIS